MSSHQSDLDLIARSNVIGRDDVALWRSRVYIKTCLHQLFHEFLLAHAPRLLLSLLHATSPSSPCPWQLGFRLVLVRQEKADEKGRRQHCCRDDGWSLERVLKIFLIRSRSNFWKKKKRRRRSLDPAQVDISKGQALAWLDPEPQAISRIIKG